MQIENPDSESYNLNLRQELAFYQAIIDTYGDAQSREAYQLVTSARLYQGVLLGQLGRWCEELQAYDDVLKRAVNISDSRVTGQTIEALAYKARRLVELGRHEEAEVTFGELCVVADGDPEAKMQALRIGIHLAVVWRRDGEATREMKVYSRLQDWLCQDPSVEIRRLLATVLVNKGVRVGQLEDSSKEFAAYQSVVDLFGVDVDPATRAQVATAMLYQAQILESTGREREALEYYEAILLRSSECKGTDPLEQEVWARALVNEGVNLHRQGDIPGALRAFREVTERFRGTTESALDAQWTLARLNEGKVLEQTGQWSEARVCYEDVVNARAGGFTEASEEAATRLKGLP